MKCHFPYLSANHELHRQQRLLSDQTRSTIELEIEAPARVGSLLQDSKHAAPEAVELDDVMDSVLDLIILPTVCHGCWL